MSLIEKINLEKIPRHVAIIMDGNGRWAKLRNKPRLFGHREGAQSVKAVIKAAIKINLKYLTIYAFSRENWQRPKDEVEGLLNLLVEAVNNELDTMKKQNIKLSVIGSLDELPENVRKSIEKSIHQTRYNTGLNLIVALNYGSRWEILEAVKKISDDICKGILNKDNINEQIFSQYLLTANIPDPDFLIRTSGEQRISNFLLWQLSYTELYFTDVLWPDFREEEFYKAILDYQKRERRFGKISEQIKNE